MPIKFEIHRGNPQAFFKLLPQDWQEAVKLIWESHSKTTSIFVLKENNTIIAGGLVFTTLTNDMSLFKKKAENLLNKESYYIGYLFVIETRRGEDLGTIWLNALKVYYPKTGFWLTIEEEKLGKFYSKNGFQMVGEVANLDGKEWLYLYSAVIA